MSNVTETPQAGASGSEQSTTEQAKERVQETAQQVQQQVGQKAQEMRGRAGERVRHELDTRSTQAGEQVTTTADAIRRVGTQLRQEGNDGPAKYADQLAERAERLGGYLTEANADRMLRDVEDFARRQPWVAALGGVTVGFLASRFLKASSASRYGQSSSGYTPYAYDDGIPALPTSPSDAGYVAHGDPAIDVPQPVAGEGGGRVEL